MELWRFSVIWMSDPCSFTSRCQVLDTEEVAVRHESHQDNQRASADLICLTLTWVLLAVPDLKREERWMNISASSSLLYQIIILENGSDTSHYETQDVIWCTAELWSNTGIHSDCQFCQWQTWHFNTGVTKNCSFFLVQDECKGEKGQSCQIHTLSHTGGAGWTC